MEVLAIPAIPLDGGNNENRLRAVGAVALLENNNGLGEVYYCSPAETALGVCLLAHLQLR